MPAKHKDLLQPFNDSKIARSFLERVQAYSREASVMEVCGTHTVALFKTGIRGVLPHNIRVISGPGCPVCVTPIETIEAAIGLACKKNTVLFCFGDMLRVPGVTDSLESARARRGAQTRMMYSPMEALDYAQKNPQERVVLFGIGFETTIPLFASVLHRAREYRMKNLFVLPAFKLIPPALHAILRGNNCPIDGFLLPGHVSAILGVQAYTFIAAEYHKPGVITGFESVDIVEGLWLLLEMLQDKKAAIKNEYSRFVSSEGNRKAQSLMKKVFAECDSSWRGLGTIPRSGLTLQKEFSSFNAESLIDFVISHPGEPEGCICGKVIQGICTPPECLLYKNACTPEHPVGPCMISSEGTCAAYYKYGGQQ